MWDPLPKVVKKNETFIGGRTKMTKCDTYWRTEKVILSTIKMSITFNYLFPSTFLYTPYLKTLNIKSNKISRKRE